MEIINETLIQTKASDGLIEIDQSLFPWESLMISFQFVLLLDLWELMASPFITTFSSVQELWEASIKICDQPKWGQRQRPFCYSSCWPFQFTTQTPGNLTKVSWNRGYLSIIILHPILVTEPRLYGERVPNRLISPRLRRVQRRIVMLHDFFRTKVVPPAANMLSMVSQRKCQDHFQMMSR